MTYTNTRQSLLAVFFLVFCNLSNRVTGASLERPVGPGKTGAECAPVSNSIIPQDCNVAVLTLPFTDKRSTLITGGNFVTSQFKSCKVVVSCASQTQTTSMALLTNNGKGGGYNLLVDQCDGDAGTIFFDQDCSVRVTKA